MTGLNVALEEKSTVIILEKNITEMTIQEWNRTHDDYKQIVNGEKSVMTVDGIKTVRIVPFDWYGASTGKARIDLINKTLSARGWINGKKGDLTAILEAERFRYLEVFRNNRVLCDVDMRGFNPVNISAYIDQLEVSISNKL